MLNQIIKPFVHLIPSNNRLERIWKIAQVDFQSRYYNDRLGLLWALIKPIFEAALYYFAFKFLLNIQTESYGLFLFGGIITWAIFGEGTTRSITLLKSKNYLLENIQFEHIDIFFSFVLSLFFAYSFNLTAFAIICVILGNTITWTLLLLPVVLLTIFLIIMAFSQILSTLQPFVKDITHLWDMIILAGFWASAIFFEPDIIFEKAMWMAYLNPFIGIIMNIRGIFIDVYSISTFWICYCFIYACIFFILSFFLYRKFGSLALEKL